MKRSKFWMKKFTEFTQTEYVLWQIAVNVTAAWDQEGDREIPYQLASILGSSCHSWALEAVFEAMVVTRFKIVTD